ncbi:MAG: hypothetical protein FD149_1396 [Rhodospirillaceae bacterium]|nr:MAG: hypothetical protein FD149_1396 [Rhodospirillaceae bacterium]
METSSFLPHLNAFLNGTTAVLLGIGFILIRKGARRAHRTVMGSALIVSVFFLASYLTYHFTAPILVFPGEGWVRPVYYAIMISHIVLATVVVPMVVLTVTQAARERFDRHKALARWTGPVWMYVALSGLVVYGMLYHVYDGLPDVPRVP